ncbi:MAG: hypothetical protein ACLPSF_14125, partial [Methylocella sp.]
PNAIAMNRRIDWRIERHADFPNGDFPTLANALLFSADWLRGASWPAARHSARACGAPKPRLRSQWLWVESVPEHKRDRFQ